MTNYQVFELVIGYFFIGHCKAAGVGIEPPIVGLTGRRLTIWPHRINAQSGRLDLNQRSPVPETGGMPRLSHVLKMRPAGIEPTHPRWQRGRLPLHHGRKRVHTRLSNTEGTRRGRNCPPLARLIRSPPGHLSYQHAVNWSSVEFGARPNKKARVSMRHRAFGLVIEFDQVSQAPLLEAFMVSQRVAQAVIRQNGTFKRAPRSRYGEGPGERPWDIELWFQIFHEVYPFISSFNRKHASVLPSLSLRGTNQRLVRAEFQKPWKTTGQFTMPVELLPDIKASRIWP